MKQTMIRMAGTLFLITGLVSIGFAGEEHGHGTLDAAHGLSQGHDMAHSGDMGLGMKIHESTVDGYTLTYHLIDMKEKMEGMGNMPDIKATHHLMVFIKDSHGHSMDKGKVGYLVTTSDGGKQKAMAMGMKGGFGADLELKAMTKYIIKTKIVGEDKKQLMDEFEYELHPMK